MIKNQLSKVQSATPQHSKCCKCQRTLSLSHIGALFILFFSISSPASSNCKPTASSNCKPTAQNTEICSVSISFAGENRSYQYEIRAPEAGKPTVIEIPGGPGLGYVGKMDQAASAALIPKGYGVIAIDPRGVGVNDYGSDTKGGNYSSDLEAKAILAIIQNEHLKNYVIHGQSFGTTVATKLGKQLSQNKQVPQPRAIVLSGVVNRAFDDQLKGFNQELQRIVEGFSPSEKFRLQQALEQILSVQFKGDKRAFAAAFMDRLLFNIEDEHSAFGPSIPDLKKFLKMLSSGDIDKRDPTYQSLLAYAQKYAGKTPEFTNVKRKNSMAEEVKCTELSVLGNEAEVSLDIQRFQFKPEHSDCQKKGYRISNPYDSKEYQIVGIPLYYFQGTLDPATPESEAKKHYGNQASTEKVYVAISRYAHLNLIGMSKCQSGLWDAIIEGPEDLVKKLKTCDDPNIKILGGEKSAARPSTEFSQSFGLK